MHRPRLVPAAPVPLAGSQAAADEDAHQTPLAPARWGNKTARPPLKASRPVKRVAAVLGCAVFALTVWLAVRDKDGSYADARATAKIFRFKDHFARQVLISIPPVRIHTHKGDTEHHVKSRKCFSDAICFWLIFQFYMHVDVPSKYACLHFVYDNSNMRRNTNTFASSLSFLAPQLSSSKHFHSRSQTPSHPHQHSQTCLGL